MRGGRWGTSGAAALGLVSVGAVTERRGPLVWENTADRDAATVSPQRCWMLFTGKNGAFLWHVEETPGVKHLLKQLCAGRCPVLPARGRV